ncbi:MAG: hypothetical protein COZ49_03340 [Candidatus Yonathbacteria bacterium CG_4_10_14_3_um_filter_47_65]|uniref:Serine aminopeptidase S33 domain-containing protein n=2 Tax=Parcubacteria group TaxID=1794811 RepID=A0A2M8D5W2_9BACT|nr:MAG: hypothetical protein AUJ44_02355 [Candidatus Nomurabacteria bacterium CG1_02_47_685]PIP04116.1 MAG: hypothetical protein COX54_00790 [Candidatus Yonathbacteria bacterium CG23_combo_of_CG06-09_8_20_14_all_46_18]PIQ32570.1 MAG: hypothetical protein COW61_01395 [Candidatus Yonathbacteria bacterium CG17_big_fil_post_rev_8_21_14_2_50_46_19]PIX56214.1 MAG: hypothetical protein COZ49_03340 [Candidatus Yonathbacteria bacterium CG_4_10_14_3_um_filter_47_65]PIY57753.1 MAG: hypothetical protein CO
MDKKMKVQSIITTFVALIIVGTAAIYWWGKTLDTPGQKNYTSDTMEKVSYLIDRIETQEGFNWRKIVGNYLPGTNDRAVILLHMMPATKESWNEFASKLNEAGYHVLAIDLWGHGESNEYKIDDVGQVQYVDYRNFTDEQHQKSIADVEGARQFLVGKGISPENIIIGGASIGANLALQYLSMYPEAPAAFLLSPGLDYRGIKTDAFMPLIGDNQKVLLVAAEDDAYSFTTVGTLKIIGDVAKTVETYNKGGHATDLFNSHPELMDDIIMWLK